MSCDVIISTAAPSSFGEALRDHTYYLCDPGFTVEQIFILVERWQECVDAPSIAIELGNDLSNSIHIT